MNVWDAKDILFSSSCADVHIAVELLQWRVQERLLEGLRTAFYPGGGGVPQKLYEGLVEAAAVHGLWASRSRHRSWTICPVGNRPEAFNKELHKRYVADCMAWNLSHGPGNKVFDGYPPNHSLFLAHTRTLQDKHWLKALAAKYVDDNYRRRIEPFIKRVENGRLIVRRTNGKWSIG